MQLKEADTSREIPVRNSPNFRSPNPGLFLHWPLGGILPKVSPSPSGATQGVTGDRSPHRATHPARPSPLLPEGGAAGGAAPPCASGPGSAPEAWSADWKVGATWPGRASEHAHRADSVADSRPAPLASRHLLTLSLLKGTGASSLCSESLENKVGKVRSRDLHPVFIIGQAGRR